MTGSRRSKSRAERRAADPAACSELDDWSDVDDTELAGEAGAADAELGDADLETPLGLPLQGLRELLGVGPSGGASSLRSLLTSLQRADDTPTRLAVLQELADTLSVATEDAFWGGVPVKGLVHELLWTLGGPVPDGHAVPDDDAPGAGAAGAATDDEWAVALAAADDAGRAEAQMYASRCMAYLLEALPACAPLLVRLGAVPLLLQHLETITLMDLAEQVLQTLEKLAATHAAAIVRAGGLVAVTQYLDFFPLYLQRTALHIVALGCEQIERELASHVEAIVPRLAEVLSSASDARMVAFACRAVGACAARLAPDGAAWLERLLPPLLPPLAALLARSAGRAATSALPRLSEAQTTALLQAMGDAARSSATLAHLLWEHEILDTLRVLLTGADAGLAPPAPQALLLYLAQRASPDQVRAALQLLVDLLPPLSEDGVLDDAAYTAKAYAQKLRRAERLGCALGEVDDVDDAPRRRRRSPPLSARAEQQRAWPHFWATFSAHMLPVCLSVYEASGAADVRAPILEAMLRTLWYAPRDALLAALEGVPLARFLATVLTTSAADRTRALQIVELLGQRLAYAAYLWREGTVAAVEHLALGAPPNYRAKLVLARIQAWPTDKATADARRELQALRTCAEGLGGADWATHLPALQRGLAHASGYELQRAGLMEALHAALTADTHAAPREQRRALLREALMPVRAPLLAALHDALSRLEDVPVVTAGGAASLSRQVSLRLEAESDTAALLPRVFHAITLAMHAIVPVRALHDFVCTKLQLAGLAARDLPDAAAPPPVLDAPPPSDAAADGVWVSDEEEDAEPASYAAAAQSPESAWHLELRQDGELLPLDTTVYACVAHDDDAPPVLRYRAVRGPLAPPSSTPGVAPRPHATPPPPPRAIDGDAPYAATLALLDALRDLWDDEAMDDMLVNTKLTAKLTQQLHEPLVVASGQLPPWALVWPHTHAFLFAFATRLAYVRRTALGRAVSLAALASDSDDDTIQALAQRPRQKVRIARDALLPSAIKVLEVYGARASILEVEYFDEVGSGLGPTLEFYAMVARECQRTDRGLWRHDTAADDEWVHAPLGLFPAAFARDDAVSLFRTLGQLVAKALVDARVVDVPLHPLFWDAVLRRRVPLTLGTLGAVDPQLRHSLQALLDMPPDDVESLQLEPTLPGTDTPLPGLEGPVQPHSVPAYVDAVLRATLHDGIAPAVDAFRGGIESIAPLSALDIFHAHELASLFGQRDEAWDEATLLRALVPDHGFSSESAQLHDLVAIMAGFDTKDRRAFLQWLTGAPRLPLGGFSALHPPLTVVRREPDAPLRPDDYLPSVMTCVNYLKLPCYSSRQVMEQRLRQAMREGLTSFHLS